MFIYPISHGSKTTDHLKQSDNQPSTGIGINPTDRCCQLSAKVLIPFHLSVCGISKLMAQKYRSIYTYVMLPYHLHSN